MLYKVNTSSIQHSISNSAKALGRKAPESLTNIPVLIAGLELYFQAFFDLDSERNHGMGLTRIPWSSVSKYAQFYDFDEDQTERLFYFISAMDSAHLERLDAERTKP